MKNILIAALLVFTACNAWAQDPQFGQKPAPYTKSDIDAKVQELEDAFVACWQNWTAVKSILGWTAGTGVGVDPKTVAPSVAQYGVMAIHNCSFMAQEMENVGQYYEDHGVHDPAVWPIPGAK